MYPRGLYTSTHAIAGLRKLPGQRAARHWYRQILSYTSWPLWGGSHNWRSCATLPPPVFQRTLYPVLKVPGTCQRVARVTRLLASTNACVGSPDHVFVASYHVRSGGVNDTGFGVTCGHAQGVYRVTGGGLTRGLSKRVWKGSTEGRYFNVLWNALQDRCDGFRIWHR